MARSRKAALPARVGTDTLRRLDRHAKRLGKPRSNLVERYVEEGLRMDEHPGVVFVDGPAGRRPALASRRGLDIWEVITTLHANDGNTADAAEVLSLPESEVRVALAYYADHRSEIDDWIRANEELFEQAEAAQRRQQDAARRR
ncbi:MAG: ribbon-helix-helix protein, CopG family [Chloroflexi bacterium]|nr:MAG: ribbon-helix-helix protein, CopG family [Chloroflexota bacterium]